MGVEGKISVGKLKGFPETGSNLESKQFLDSATELLALYEYGEEFKQIDYNFILKILSLDSFGTLFSPAENDFKKNIEALAKLYNEDKDKYFYLETFIIESSKKNDNEAAIKLYWLLQHAEITEAFLNNLLNDELNEHTSVELFQQAYDATIRKNHGFIVREAIKLYLNLIPSKDDLFGTEEYFEENIKHLKRLVPILTKAIEEVNLILEKIPYTL